MKRIISILILSVFYTFLYSQQEINLSYFLGQIKENNANYALVNIGLNLARKKVSNFRSEQMPNISANLQLLDFYNTSRPITQPNGAIDFLNVSQNTSDIFIEASYSSILTGGTLFMQSNLRRFDDFSFNSNQYNSVPVRLGIIQPIFGHNFMKWQKVMNELNLKHEEVRSEIEIKGIELKVVNYFFEVIYAFEVYQDGLKRLDNAKFLYKQYEDKMKLGTGEMSDFLFLELELERSKFHIDKFKNTFLIAEDKLWTFIGRSRPSGEILYRFPEINELIDIDSLEAINQFNRNSPSSVLFEMESLEIEREIDQINKTKGVRGNVIASFGITKASESIDELLQSPLKENQINITATVPIFDWGRKNNSLALLKIKKEEQSLIKEISEIDNVQRLNNEINIFKLSKNNISSLNTIHGISNKRYQKVIQKYRLGDLPTSDLIRAIRDLDLIKLEKLNNTKLYWTSLFKINYLTGYSYSDLLYPELR